MPDEGLPEAIPPMLAVPVAEPFDSPDHIFEPAWDGVRALAFIEGGRLRLQARNLDMLMGQCPEMEALPGLVSGDGVVLDGEIVTLDAAGRPSLSRLHDRLRRQSREGPERAARRIPATYMAFDILYWAHRPLLSEPLMRRRDVLQQVARTEGPLRVAEFVESAGVSFFQVVEQLGLEGMVAKHRDGIYLPGRRSPYWLRVRVARSGLFVIGGGDVGGGEGRPPVPLPSRGAGAPPPPSRSCRCCWASTTATGWCTRAASAAASRTRPARRRMRGLCLCTRMFVPSPARPSRFTSSSTGARRSWSAKSSTARWPRTSACAFRCSWRCVRTSPRATARRKTRRRLRWRGKPSPLVPLPQPEGGEKRGRLWEDTSRALRQRGAAPLHTPRGRKAAPHHVSPPLSI